MNQQSQAVEVDVLALLRRAWQRKFFILFISLIGSGIALGVSLFLITPKYTSTTQIYVVARSDDRDSNLTAQDLQAGQYLTNDYREIITSKAVLAKVIDAEKLNLTTDQLRARISVAIPTDTRVISISYTDTDNKKASQITNTIRKEAAAQIKDVTKAQDISVIESAEPSDKPSSPNTRRNIIIGFAAGFVVAVVIVTLTGIFDDRIRRQEDIEEILQLTVLGIVPNIKN